jgi:hypothetical protein
MTAVQSNRPPFCAQIETAIVADGHLRRFDSVVASNLLVTAAATAFKECSEHY